MTSESTQHHLRLVSLLTLVGGVIGLLPGILLMLVSAGLMSAGAFGFGTSSGEMFLAGGIVGLVALVVFMIGLPAIIAGFGLLARKPWARPLTVVVALFNLFGFPLGTLLGAYQLWVLAVNKETVAAYKGAADAPRVQDYA